MISEQAIRSFSINVFLVATGFTGLVAASHPGATARLLELDVYPWANDIFSAGLAIAMASFMLLGIRLLLVLGRRLKSLGAGPPRAEAGVIIVEFTLVLPIVLLVMGMCIQMALLANASLVVRHASFVSARAAIVGFERSSILGLEESIPSSNRQKAEKAAQLIVASISPQTSDSDAAATAIRKIFSQQAGRWGSRGYVNRMGYAKAATSVSFNESYPPADFIFNQVPSQYTFTGFGSGTFNNLVSGFAGDMGIPLDFTLPSMPFNDILSNLNIPNILGPKQVEVTVEYKFLITIPGITLLPGITTPAPGGVSGRVFPIEHTVRLQSTGARISHPVSLLGGTPVL